MNTITITVNGNNNTGPLFGSLNHSVNNFVNNTNHQFNQLNQNITNNYHGMFGSIISAFGKLPGVVQAAVITSAAAVAFTFASAIGAALNAMLLTVVGGGVIALGIVKAAQDPAVSTAFTKLGREISTQVGYWAKSFVTPLVNSAKLFGDAWRSAVGPGIERAFHVLAPVVERLGLGLAGLATNAMPGFNKAIDAARPVLEKFAQLLPEIGRGLSDFFDSLSSSGDGAIKGMVFLVALLVGTLDALGETVEFLSKAFDFMTEKSEKVNTALSKIPVLGKIFEPMAEWMSRFNETAEAGSGVLAKLGGNFIVVAESEQMALEAAMALDQQMDSLFKTMTSATDASIRYEQAIDDLTDSFKENGRNIDITTGKGRENVKAVEEVARAAYAAREAAIAMAGGENASAAAVHAANAKFYQQIDALRAQLQAMGLTKAQIDQLLGGWYALANAPNINKTVTVRTVYIGGKPVSAAQQSGSYSSGIGGRAHGGIASGLKWVGEGGKPELVDFSQGRVYSHATSKEMTRKSMVSSSSEGLAINVYVQGSIRSDRDLVGMIRNAFQSGAFRGVVKTA